MRIANIVPPKLLDTVLGDQSKEDYHLLLAEVMMRDGSRKYRDFYNLRKSRGDFIILDNGAYEYGTTPDLQTVIDAAAMCPPDEIVLPDAMHGETCSTDTIRMSTDGAWTLRNLGYSRFMAVPHGNTFKEWLLCAQILARIDGVVSIGIAEKDAIKLSHGHRVDLIRAVKDLQKEIHLLGMMEDMSDVLEPWVQRTVRGVDGGKLVAWGLDGVRVSPSERLPPYKGRPQDFFDIELTDVSPNNCWHIRRNIIAWREHIYARPR